MNCFVLILWNWAVLILRQKIQLLYFPNYKLLWSINLISLKMHHKGEKKHKLHWTISGICLEIVKFEGDLVHVDMIQWHLPAFQQTHGNCQLCLGSLLAVSDAPMSLLYIKVVRNDFTLVSISLAERKLMQCKSGVTDQNRCIAWSGNTKKVCLQSNLYLSPWPLPKHRDVTAQLSLSH